MKQVKVNIGDKTYFCDVFESEEDKKKGLMGVENLPVDRGALFIWEDEDTREMYMKDTPIPLDQIAINEDDEVVSVYRAQPNDETLIPFPNTKYILEVNQNSGIVEGDDFDIEEDMDKYVMKILAPDGSTQMFLQGGERIYSRQHSRVLIKKAKRAYEVRNNEAQYNSKCKALGKFMFKVLKKQDTQAPEYVEIPK